MYEYTSQRMNKKNYSNSNNISPNSRDMHMAYSIVHTISFNVHAYKIFLLPQYHTLKSQNEEQVELMLFISPT